MARRLLISPDNASILSRTRVRTRGRRVVADHTYTPVSDDILPTAFAFIDVLDAAPDTEYESNTITLLGIDGFVDVSVVDGEFSKNGAPYTDVPTIAVNGNTFTVKGVSPGVDLESTNVRLTIGSLSDIFTIRTNVNGTFPFYFMGL
jgi:hypothetical protein